MRFICKSLGMRIEILDCIITLFTYNLLFVFCTGSPKPFYNHSSWADISMSSSLILGSHVNWSCISFVKVWVWVSRFLIALLHYSPVQVIFSWSVQRMGVVELGDALTRHQLYWFCRWIYLEVNLKISWYNWDPFLTFRGPPY